MESFKQVERRILMSKTFSVRYGVSTYETLSESKEEAQEMAKQLAKDTLKDWAVIKIIEVYSAPNDEPEKHEVCHTGTLDFSK